MTYAAVRDSLLFTLQGATNFSDTNVVYEDEQVLNSGIQRAIILRYAGVVQSLQAFGPSFFADWRFKAEMYSALYDDIPSARATQDTDRQAIIDVVNGNPALNGSDFIIIANLVSATPATDAVEFGGLHFLREDFMINVREDEPATAVR